MAVKIRRDLVSRPRLRVAGQELLFDTRRLTKKGHEG